VWKTESRCRVFIYEILLFWVNKGCEKCAKNLSEEIDWEAGLEWGCFGCVITVESVVENYDLWSGLLEGV
jgi:hypothetical protein